MDDELKRYLEAMEGRLLKQINDGHERILNRIATVEHDFSNMKGFLVGDALVASRRWLDLEGRVSNLERKSGGT